MALAKLMFESSLNCRKNLMKTSHTLLGGAEHLLTTLADASADELTVVRAELDAGFDEVGHNFNDARLALMKQAAHASELTQDYVSDNPWRFLGAVVVAGMVIGVLLSRR